MQKYEILHFFSWEGQIRIWIGNTAFFLGEFDPNFLFEIDANPSE